MAEGIKISQLTNVAAKNGDYTVVVQDGITRRAYISSIIDLANGVTVDLSKAERNINTLSGNIKTLSGNISDLSVNVKSISSTIIPSLSNDLVNRIDSVDGKTTTVNRKIDDLSTSLSSLSSLTKDPNMLTSLESIVALLSGEDGSIALSGITKTIDSISSEVSEVQNVLDKNITPKLDEAYSALANLAEDSVYVGQYGENSFVLLSNGYNDTYDFYYDTNRPANINTIVSGYALHKAELSGIDTTTEDIKNVIAYELSIPSINDLEYNYDSKENIFGLSNLSLISGEGVSANVGTGLSSISVYFKTDLINNNDITTVSVSISSVTAMSCVPGTKDFSLDMIPIRSGMFKNDGENYIVFSGKLSGTTDFALYYIKDATVLDGIPCKVNVIVDGRKIASRKNVVDTTGEETDLDLVMQQRLKGGTTIQLALADPEGNYKLSNGVLIEDNLIGAILAKRIPSENEPLKISYLTAFTPRSIVGGPETFGPSQFLFSTINGCTGDVYDLSVQYSLGDISKQAIYSGESEITVDNTNFGSLYTYTMPTDYDKGNYLSAGCELTVNLTKKDDPSVVVSKSFVITSYVNEAD